MNRTAVPALAAVLLAGLAPAAPVPKELKANADYFPMKVGMRWEYSADGGETTDHTREVISSEEKDGVRTVVIEWKKGQQTQNWEFRVDKDGLSRTKQGSLEYEPPHLLLKAKVEAGDEWESTFKLSGQTEYRYRRTVGKAEPVKVPAGTFSAVRITNVNLADGDEKATLWYAPGVGLVKYEPANLPPVVLTRFSTAEDKKK